MCAQILVLCFANIILKWGRMIYNSIEDSLVPDISWDSADAIEAAINDFVKSVVTKPTKPKDKQYTYMTSKSKEIQ